MKLLKTLFLGMMIGLLAGCGTFEIRIEATPTAFTAATRPNLTVAAPTPTASATPASTPGMTPTPKIVSPAQTLSATPAAPFAGLVYRDGDSLYRLGPDGQPQPLAAGLDPQILPGQFTPRAVVSADGAQMVSWWDFSDLWLVDLATGKVNNLTNTPDRVECCAQFWPAHPDRVVFMSQPVENQGQSIGYPTLIKLDGSGYQVLDESSASLGLPAPAPLGNQIAYDRAGEPWLYNLDKGLEPLNPAGFGVQDAAGDLKLASPAWSPDGKLLAWIASGAIGPNGANVFSPVIFNLDAKTYLLLDKTSSAGGEGWPAAPVWSADGGWLAFQDLSNDNFGMWIARANGTDEKRIYQPATVRGTTGLQALWSPQADLILVVDPNANGGIDTRLIDAATGQTLANPLPKGAIPIAWVQP